MDELELSPCEYGEEQKDDDVEDISELDDLFDDYDGAMSAKDTVMITTLMKMANG